MATTAKIAKDEKLAQASPENAKASVSPPEPLLALWTPARIPAQVRRVPSVFPAACPERRDSRRGEGELVRKGYRSDDK